jgi:CHAT domain-containing protein/Tfp pilus assembly protein PilF
LLIILSLATSVRAESASGVIIESVSGGPSADKTILQIGDRIVVYNGRTISSPAALDAAQQNTFDKNERVVEVRRVEETLHLALPSGFAFQVRPDFSPKVGGLYERGKTALQGGHELEAVAKWEVAAQAAGKESGAPAAAWLYLQAAQVRGKIGHGKEELTDLLSAWDLLKEGRDGAAQSVILVELGRYSMRHSDYPAAEKWFRQAHQVDEAAGNRMWAAADVARLGVMEYERGNLEAAVDYQNQALAVREKLAPDSLPVASSLTDLGNIADDRGELQASKNYHLRALAIRERFNPDSLDVARSLNNLGIVVMELGEFQAAAEYYNRGLSIKERLLPDSMDVANSLNNLGNVSMFSGDLRGAHDYHTRALAIRQRLAPDSLDVSASLSNLADVAWRQGDLDASRDYNTRALEIRERLAPNSLLIATSLVNLGLIAAEEHDFQLAIRYQRRALEIQRQLAPDSMTVASSLINLGEIAFASGDLVAAQDYQTRALGIQEKAAPDSLEVSYSLTALGKVALAAHNFGAARDDHTRALAIRGRLAPASVEFAETLTKLGEVAFAEGKFQEAESFFTRAVAIVESQRSQIPSAEARAFLVAKQIEPFAGLIRTELALGDKAAAFATSERAHARSLLDLLKEAHADIRQGIDPVLLKRERSVRQQLNAKAEQQSRMLSNPHTQEEANAAAREIDDITSNYNQVELQIRVASPHYAELTQPQPLSLKEIQEQVLDADTLLLEYSLGDDASFLFVVGPTSLKSYALPRRSEVEAAARRLYDAVSARNRHRADETPAQKIARVAHADADYPEAALALSRMVLAPALAELGSKRLVIVADGALLQIPFVALVDPSSANAQPLLANHEVVSLPSASVLAVQRAEVSARKPAGQRLALFADPVFERDDPRVTSSARRAEAGGKPGSNDTARDAAISQNDEPQELERAAGEAGVLDGKQKIRRLPFSRTEAAAIFSLLPRGDGLKALDFDASRAAVTSADLSRYRIVHFATHALVNSEHPELSGIVLSLLDRRGQPVDGFLRLNEIYNLNLPVDLVVLSACQTALGKEVRAEGLIGLLRGFMYAGAARVVASQWKVDDEATSELMGRFYEKMLKRGEPAAAALRQAQLEMSRQSRWHAPYFWAAFAIQGEWK